MRTRIFVLVLVTPLLSSLPAAAQSAAARCDDNRNNCLIHSAERRDHCTDPSADDDSDCTSRCEDQDNERVDECEATLKACRAMAEQEGDAWRQLAPSGH